jgi:hypothetical protein
VYAPCVTKSNNYFFNNQTFIKLKHQSSSVETYMDSSMTCWSYLKLADSCLNPGIYSLVTSSIEDTIVSKQLNCSFAIKLNTRRISYCWEETMKADRLPPYMVFMTKLWKNMDVLLLGSTLIRPSTTYR